MIKKTLFILTLFSAAVSTTYSEDLKDLLELIDGNIFSVNVIARIYDSGKVSSWEMEMTKYTISGRKISIRLDGEELVVIADITPYIDSMNDILLVAQGQVWVDTPGEEKVKYSSALKSLPVKLGDKVYFYPLGVTKNYNAEMFILELEIQVLPYQNIARSAPE